MTRVAVGLVVAVLGLAIACGTSPGSNNTQIKSPDAGVDVDAGDDPDAGEEPDGGEEPEPSPLPEPQVPTLDGWTFVGGAQGGPNQVFGASLDEGGNLWVAGGEDGLYVLRAGAERFERFTMADGLRPFGYMPDGSDPPGDKYLKVLSVSGGPPGVAFVGYAGKEPGAGELDCENNWDGPSPNPAIYKSGDADRVTLTEDGISVVHYDISSGHGIVSIEPQGREKLCHVLRIRYDPANQRVWFGANHGLAMGDANHPGTQNCRWADTPNPTPPPVGTKSDPFSNDFGHFGCSGVLEHAHPAISGLRSDGSCCSLLTGGYYGVSLEPATGDVWFGGQMRTTRFRYATNGSGFYAAQAQTENAGFESNRIDVWPDRVQEPERPSVSDRVDDHVSGVAGMPDGSVWLSSFVHGLAHVDAGGAVTRRVSTPIGHKLGALARDPLDDSLWTGGRHVGGVTRMKDGAFTTWDGSALGIDLADMGVADVQATGSGASRKIVVGFTGNAKHSGVVGIYSGP